MVLVKTIFVSKPKTPEIIYWSGTKRKDNLPQLRHSGYFRFILYRYASMSVCLVSVQYILVQIPIKYTYIISVLRK